MQMVSATDWWGALREVLRRQSAPINHRRMVYRTIKQSSLQETMILAEDVPSRRRFVIHRCEVVSPAETPGAYRILAQDALRTAEEGADIFIERVRPRRSHDRPPRSRLKAGQSQPRHTHRARVRQRSPVFGGVVFDLSYT